MPEEEKKTFSVESVEEMVAPYLVPHGWKRMDIGVYLMFFVETHGDSAISAMGRYIEWAEELGKKDNEIAVTLGHDLNGSKDKYMLPRSSSW